MTMPLRPRVHSVSRSLTVALTATALQVCWASGCSSYEDRIGLLAPEPPSFTNADASAVEASTEVSLCPVTTCTLPWATCPSSEFPCSTNLLSDDENCGGCGLRCPRADEATKSIWACVDGKCSLACTDGRWADCDGDLTNGCETPLDNTDNCGGCGDKCQAGMTCDHYVCVDRCVQQGLPDRCYWFDPVIAPDFFDCVDFASDDRNCGACGVVCDPTGPDLPPLPDDMYYGCSGGKCGAPKCGQSGKANCNGALEDGCEITLHTDEHCAHCDDTCSPPTTCRQHPSNMAMYVCMTESVESCASQDNPMSCGTCGHECPGLRAPQFRAACIQGICGGECHAGYADCNESLVDGCEVNKQVDNRNCGVCGNACLPEQVCFQGQCQVAPCDGGVSGGPTK